MKKRQIFILLTTLFCLSSLNSFAAEEIPYGIVNFGNCVTESKYGKQEQESFELPTSFQQCRQFLRRACRQGDL